MSELKRLTKKEINELPQNIKNNIFKTLKNYYSVHVVFENGEYDVMTGWMVKGYYADDYKIIGEAYSKDIL